jgi:phenol hydroxylase P2 protein
MTADVRHDDLSKYTTGAWTGHFANISIDLQDCDEARAVADAVVARNDDVEVLDQLPGLLTVRCPNRMVIRQDDVEEALGAAWNPRDLQALLTAYAGNITSSGQDGLWVLEWLGQEKGETR